METVQFTVRDMTCDGCAGRIRTALESSGKAAGIEIDVNSHRVSIQGEETEDVYAGIIQAAGYTPEKSSAGMLGRLFGK